MQDLYVCIFPVHILKEKETVNLIVLLNIFKCVLGKILIFLFIFLDKELMMATKESHK